MRFTVHRFQTPPLVVLPGHPLLLPQRSVRDAAINFLHSSIRNFYLPYPPTSTPTPYVCKLSRCSFARLQREAIALCSIAAAGEDLDAAAAAYAAH
jgi:hypothetical protein